MVLFWRLLLAHLIADFPLQTDAVFAVKKGTRWGVVLHATLFGLTAILLVRHYLSFREMWSGLIFLWLFHIAIDKAKLAFAGRGGGDQLAYFLLDQALHVGAIALICLFFKRLALFPSSPDHLATDLHFIRLGIAYVTAVWASPLLSFYLASVFAHQELDFKAQQHPQMRILGYWERGALVAMVTQWGWLVLLAPLIFLPRISFSQYGKQRSLFRWELVLGSSLSILMGLWGRT